MSNERQPLSIEDWYRLQIELAHKEMRWQDKDNYERMLETHTHTYTQTKVIK